MVTSRQVLSDGSILERNETQLRGETPDKNGLKYEEKRTYPENGMPLRSHTWSTTNVNNEREENEIFHFEKNSSLGGYNSFDFSINFKTQNKTSNLHTTNGYGKFGLKINGEDATFYDLTDEEFAMISTAIPQNSSKEVGRNSILGGRIMSMDLSQTSPKTIECLTDLSLKNYPEATLVLANMYQQQATQANQSGDQNTFLEAKRKAKSLFGQIANNEGLSKEFKDTAIAIQKGELKGKNVHNMLWARKSADEVAKFATVMGIAGTITAGIGLTAVLGASLATAAVISPAIGLAVGGAILLDKYRNSTTSEKSGFKSVLKTEIKDAISLLTGGR